MIFRLIWCTLEKNKKKQSSKSLRSRSNSKKWLATKRQFTGTLPTPFATVPLMTSDQKNPSVSEAAEVMPVRKASARLETSIGKPMALSAKILSWTTATPGLTVATPDWTIAILKNHYHAKGRQWWTLIQNLRGWEEWRMEGVHPIASRSKSAIIRVNDQTTRGAGVKADKEWLLLVLQSL